MKITSPSKFVAALVLPLALLFTACPPPLIVSSRYTVTFDKNGGATDASPTTLTVAKSNPTIGALPTAPIRSDYAFTGWNTKADGSGTTFTASTDVISNITVYAQWQINSSAEEIRSFYATDLITNQFYSINAVKLAEGQHCIVYADGTVTVSNSAAEAIVKEYETKIHTPITDAFGMFEDVDSNGKVIFLLLDIRDDYKGSGTSYVAGFFQSYHMFENSTSYPYSNEADMLFLDTSPQQVGSEGFYSTMAHEFQHLINFSNTSLKNGKMEDLWIDEGLATAAEYIYSGHQKSRIDLFNNDPYKSIRYGNNFFVWNGYWESTAAGASYDPIANYATDYLFFQWLRIQASNGMGIYKEIIDSSYGDYRAVTEAARNRIDPSFGDWEPLLRTWMLANAYSEPSGLLGYKNEIKTNIWTISSSLGSRNLAPGEGVFSSIPKTSGPFTPGSSSGYIHYAGFDPSSIDIVDIVPPYSGQYLLTFNANSNNSGGSETGYLASGNARSAGESMRIGRTLDDATEVAPTEAAPLGPFPIDVQFNPDGTVRRGNQ